jgi:endo-1,4-beta-xylanase
MKKTVTGTRTLITFITVFIFTAVIMLLSGFSNSNPGDQDTAKGLKDYYESYFPVGVAVSPDNIEGETGELIKKNFNSLTAENVMKPALIHPEENRYSWDNADKIVNFAQANGMKVRGHTLCWHNQTGAWMFKDAQGNQVTKEVALARLKEHITTVVSHYKGKIYAWDVLNEAVVDGNDPNKVYRETMWYKICGEEFIPKIFQWAHEADPDAVLFYNDYNTENPVKRDKIYNMLKKLIEDGVPIHAVGLQGHWKINDPSEKDLRDAIDKYSSLGLKVQITELDVSVLTSRNDTVKTFTPDREQKQMDLYRMAFKVFREKKDVITGVTFWNISDGRSWLDRQNRQNYPLLFDYNLKPKKAYWEVVKFE